MGSQATRDETQLLIGGRWADAGDGTYDIVNPATEQVVGQAPNASVDDANAAAQAAREAFPAWAATPVAVGGAAALLVASTAGAAPALSVAVLSTILAMAGGHRLIPDPAAFKVVFIACAAIGVIGVLFALKINDADAASTMRKKAVVATPSPIAAKA